MKNAPTVSSQSVSINNNDSQLHYSTNHPYLERKGIGFKALQAACPGRIEIRQDSVRTDTGTYTEQFLFRELVDISGAHKGYERILPERITKEEGGTPNDKFTSPGSKVSGTFTPIGFEASELLSMSDWLIVCAGLADGYRLHEATGLPVACCVGENSIRGVVEAITPLNPNIFAAVDNDEAGKRAGELLQAPWCCPESEKDWSDVYQSNGLAEVKRQFEAGIKESSSPSSDSSEEKTKAVFELPDYPAELLDLPYQLGELQAFVFNRMTYPSVATAGIAALNTLTAFAQTNIVINSRDGLGFNEFYMVLAPTGFGKEDLRKPPEILNKLADSGAGNLAELNSVKIHYAAPASAQGIHQTLEQNRSALFLSDEFSEWLCQSHKDANKQAALGYLMQVYSKATGVIEPGHAVTQKYEPVKNPRLSIMATNTAERMFETMTREQGDAGAYNRWVIFAGEQELPQKRYTGLVYEPKQALVDFIGWVKALPDDTRMKFSPGGFEAFMRLDDTLAEPIKRKDALLGGRLGEQAIKMAALIALSDRRFVIEASDFETAFNIRIGLYHRAAALARHEGKLEGLHATGHALEQVRQVMEKLPGMYISQIANHSRRYKKLSLAERNAVIEALASEGTAERDPGRKAYLRSQVYFGQ